jgi:hypothetical protein
MIPQNHPLDFLKTHKREAPVKPLALSGMVRRNGDGCSLAMQLIRLNVRNIASAALVGRSKRYWPNSKLSVNVSASICRLYVCGGPRLLKSTTDACIVQGVSQCHGFWFAAVTY